MTIIGLRWAENAATDIHLTPNLSSPELTRLLVVDDLTGDTLTSRRAKDAGVALTYTPQVKVGVDHGFTVDANGQVTVTSLAMKGHSFILNVHLDENPDISTRVRVHVHEKISALWLTPSRLTVRQNAQEVRFSVLALFDQVINGTVLEVEGIIADISNWSPFVPPADAADLTYVHVSGTTTPAVTWSATGGPVTVADARTGILAVPVAAGPNTRVTATLAAQAGGKTADGTAVCAPPWSTPVLLKHLGGPGSAKAADVRNILFLSEGFQETDRPQYERFVNLVKDRMETRNRSRPFAALTGRINYWRGWVPSPEAGVTVLQGLDQTPTTILDNRANHLPLPSLGARPAANWSIENVINAIGLPNGLDYPTADQVRLKIGFLQNLYGDSITLNLLNPRLDEWVNLNDRLLVNERDTAFHMAFGERPSIDVRRTKQVVATNSRRLADEDVNTFLDALRPERGPALPAGLWTTGRDRNLVVMICRSSHVGGVTASRQVSATEFGRTLGVSLADRDFHQVELSSRGDGFDLVPDDIPTNVFYSVWLTTAHELGHAFGLADEYGGKTSAPTTLKIRDVGRSPNVQDRASLLTGGSIDVNKIKWSDWPRIDKAGVLRNGLAAPVGNRFTVDIVDVRASGLGADDIVMFRRRPLATAGPPSDICKVLAVDVPNNRVFVELLFGGAVDPARFPAGSILLSYVRGPDPDFANNRFGGVVPLADATVLTRIGLTQNPLNAQPRVGEATGTQFDVDGRPCRNVRLRTPTQATNFPDRKAPQPPRFSSWTIGIYENGGEHNCGIFRPTGTCIMNRQSNEDTKAKTLNLYEYCMVCRYAFVDDADPTMHGQVERDFRARYGKRGTR